MLIGYSLKTGNSNVRIYAYSILDMDVSLKSNKKITPYKNINEGFNILYFDLEKIKAENVNKRHKITTRAALNAAMYDEWKSLGCILK